MSTSQFMEALEKTMVSLNWHDLAQQTVTRTSPYVEMTTFNGENTNYDRMGDAETEKSNGYGEKVKQNTVPVDTRKLSSDRFYTSMIVDSAQVRRIMRASGDALNGLTMEFASKLVSKGTEAMNRRKDRVALEALFADVYTGKGFTTTVTAANDGVETITATSGITYATVQNIFSNFQANEVTNEASPKLAWFLSEEEMSDLMTISELINNNFITVATKEGDRIKSIDGMDLIVYGSNVAAPLLTEASSVRATGVLAQGGIAMGVSKNLSIEIDKLPETLETWLVKVWMEIGAVRTEGKRVQKVNTAAS